MFDANCVVALMVFLITLSGLFKKHFWSQFQSGSCSLDLVFKANPGSKSSYSINGGITLSSSL